MYDISVFYILFYQDIYTSGMKKSVSDQLMSILVTKSFRVEENLFDFKIVSLNTLKTSFTK